MRIISVGLYNPVPIKSGVDSYIQYLLKSLGEKNEITHFYFYKSDERSTSQKNNENFQSKYLKSNLFSDSKNIPKLLRLIRPDLYVNKHSLMNVTTDVVLCDTFTFNVANFISKKNKCPIILIKHNIEWKYIRNDNSKLYVFLKAYEHYTNKKSDAIITISMNDYHYMIKNYPNKKNFYVPHHVNTDLFNPFGPAYNFGNDRLNLLFYGSLDRPMNIAALRFIKHNLIPNLNKRGLLGKIRMNIFGSGNPPNDLDLKNDTNINFLGLVDNPGNFIRGADLILVPLRNSGGLKIRLLESLYCGKPIIATNEAVNGLSEELKKMVIIKNDANGFAEIIHKYIKNQKVKPINKLDFNHLKNQMKGKTIQYALSNCIKKTT